MPTTLYDLYEPLAAPGPSGGSAPPPATTTPQGVTPPTGSPQAWGTQAQQAMVGALAGTAPTVPPATLPVGQTPPVDTKSTTTPPPEGTKTEGQASDAGAYTGPIFKQEDISNVGGVVGSEPIDRTAKIAEAVYEEDKLLAGMKAAEAGYTKGGGDLEQGAGFTDESLERQIGGMLMGDFGLSQRVFASEKKEKTGKAAARAYKQDDRTQDRERRNQEFKDCKRRTGNTKKCRDIKQKTRKSERKQRRDVFDEYQEYAKGKD